MQELIQSLSHTTASLARVERGEPREVEKALMERARAIEAIRHWLAREQPAAPPPSEELAGQLSRELENGRQILLRLTLAREVMRSDHLALDREVQTLRGIQRLFINRSGSLSCRG